MRSHDLVEDSKSVHNAAQGHGMLNLILKLQINVAKVPNEKSFDDSSKVSK